MSAIRPIACSALISLLLSAPLAAGEPAAKHKRHDPTQLLAAQRTAMAPLAVLDGQWRGTATMTAPDGSTSSVTQTERVGSMLDGTVKVIEGRGYAEDGKTVFNAFAIVSYDPATKNYSLRSYAQGHANDFAFKPTADGFSWDIPAGPATMRYTASIKDGVWTEIGERIVPDKPPVRFIELKLQRIGDGGWPATGAVPMK